MLKLVKLLAAITAVSAIVAYFKQSIELAAVSGLMLIVTFAFWSAWITSDDKDDNNFKH